LGYGKIYTQNCEEWAGKLLHKHSQRHYAGASLAGEAESRRHSRSWRSHDPRLEAAVILSHKNLFAKNIAFLEWIFTWEGI
jgi:hypothetical protein